MLIPAIQSRIGIKRWRFLMLWGIHGRRKRLFVVGGHIEEKREKETNSTMKFHEINNKTEIKEKKEELFALIIFVIFISGERNRFNKREKNQSWFSDTMLNWILIIMKMKILHNNCFLKKEEEKKTLYITKFRDLTNYLLNSLTIIFNY